MKTKRILALGGVILIAVLYAATLICAFIGSPNARDMLMASLFCTIVVPVILYAYQIVYRLSKKDREKDNE